MPVMIRPAVPAEATAIWQLTLDAYAPHRERLHPPSGVFRETVADVARAIDEGTIFVACLDHTTYRANAGANGDAETKAPRTAGRDGAIVGAARVHRAEPGVAGTGIAGTGTNPALYCGRLAVLPAMQGQGIGTALMERVERHARDAGYGAVVLGVRLELPGNLRFYGRRGYRVAGEESHPGYTTPTFVWLRKDLD